MRFEIAVKFRGKLKGEGASANNAGAGFWFPA